MIDLTESAISEIILHKVGNKAMEEPLVISTALSVIDPGAENALKQYFTENFKSEILYNLYHEQDINLNTVYTHCSKIFDGKSDLNEESGKIARHLYELGDNPKYLGGDLWMVRISNILFDEEVIEGIGLYRSEKRGTFLKLVLGEDTYAVQAEQGIYTGAIDKACLVLNTNRENGYLALIADNGKSADNRFWTDTFLSIKQNEDDFFHTQNAMRICRDFIVDQLPNDFEVNRIDQADLLNKSMAYFKESEAFAVDQFIEEVIDQKEVAESFKHYIKVQEREQNLPESSKFEISEQAVKKQSRVFKSVIKLDKNFHIYVHGNRHMIERGFNDEQGLHYYQLYFKDEI